MKQLTKPRQHGPDLVAVPVQQTKPTAGGLQQIIPMTWWQKLLQLFGFGHTELDQCEMEDGE